MTASAWGILAGLTVFAIVVADALVRRGRPNIGAAAVLAIAMAVADVPLLRHAGRPRRVAVDHPWLVAAMFGFCGASLTFAYAALATGGAPVSQLIGVASLVGAVISLMTGLMLTPLGRRGGDG